MSKLIAIILSLFAILYVYNKFLASPSPAYQAYEKFSDAYARDEYAKAKELSAGQTLAMLEELTKPKTAKIYGKTLNFSPPSVSDIAGTISWIKRSKKSEVKDGANKVKLEVLETDCRIPSGITSAYCKWAVDFNQEIELEKTGSDWKVTMFKSTRTN